MFEDRINTKIGNSKSALSISIDDGDIMKTEENIDHGGEESSNEQITEKIDDSDCIFNDLRQERYQIQHQNLMGMTVTSGSVVLNKDEKNLIGISIGGGAPLCPCLYIVQIFDNTPASKDGTLQSGDELVGVNSQTVKGKTKVEVAKMIQSAKDQVTINYNKLHADPKQGKSLDIIMKKMKHRLVENMSTGTADALGLSRAILCNDTLVAKLNEMRETENTYKRLVEHAKRMLKSYFDLLQTYKSLGDIFASIGVREPQARASEAFTKFGQYHRLLERDGIKMLKTLKPNFSSKNVSRFTCEPDIIKNVFNLEILEDVQNFGFKVVGKPPPEHPPYLISLKINGEEKCEKPTRVVFNNINGTSIIEHYWPAAPDKFCGRRKVYNKHTELIVSGSITKSGYWPWHVALYGRQYNTLKYRCGGTILSKLLVLTAAHCVTKNGAPINPESIGVVLGKFRLLSTEITTQDKEIFRIIVHDEFDHRKLNNDIALLQLDSEANFNNYVQPACLWFDDIYDQLDSYEVKGKVVGWGFDHAQATTNELREITIPLVAESLCIRYDAVFYSNILNEKKFCAGYNNGTAACNGDSGGGFVVFVPDARISSYSYPLESRPGA